MPCDCSHMNPTQHELESKAVARHLNYVNHMLGVASDPVAVKTEADYYGDTRNVHKLTADLCGKLRAMPPEQFERVVYDARSRKSRALADWWELHQKADAAKG